MASIYDLLIGKSQGEYYANDPFFTGGLSLARTPTPQARTNAEALWMPALQGLLSGGLIEYGKQQANKTAYDDHRSLLGMLGGERSAPVPDVMPEGWTVDNGQQSLMLEVLRKQQDDELAQKKAEAGYELEKLLAGKGLTATPEGLRPIAGFAAANAAIAGAEKAAARTAEIQAEADAMGYNPKVEDETDKLRKEFTGLPEVKNYSMIDTAAKTVTKALADPSAVSDQELVRRTIQLIEPGMAVREGEQAAVAASQSIPEKWKGALNKSLKGGTALNPQVREGIARLAQRAFEGHKEKYDTALGFYKNQAIAKKLDPSRVSYLGESTPTEAIFAAPTKIINGVTYKKVPGGWEAQ